MVGSALLSLENTVSRLLSLLALCVFFLAAGLTASCGGDDDADKGKKAKAGKRGKKSGKTGKAGQAGKGSTPKCLTNQRSCRTFAECANADGHGMPADTFSCEENCCRTNM